MDPWHLVPILKNESSKNKKMEILSKLPEDSEFWKGSFMVNDVLLTFGVKKLPTPRSFGTGAKWQDFVKLASDLETRTLTGNAAQDAIQAFAETCNELQWEWWYSRILQKNLDCGAVTIINKTAPEKWRVKPFSCMLASDSKNAKDHHWPKRAYLEAKYDGVRALFFIEHAEPEEPDSIFEEEVSGPKATVRAFSRNGKEWENFHFIADHLAELVNLDHIPEGGLVIDGEVIGPNFQNLMKQARRKEDVKTAGIMIMVFDVVDLEDFMDHNFTVPLSDRRTRLEKIVDDLERHLIAKGENPLVALSEAVKGVDPITERQLVLDFFQQQLEAGFEGIMIKDANAPYEAKRSKAWLKMKPTETWDLAITDLIEGTGKYVGMLGAIQCSGTTKDGEFLEVSVGSGLSDQQRQELWDDRGSLIGQVIEVKADTVSQNQDGSYSLRFPRFIRFRDDKDAHEAA